MRLNTAFTPTMQPLMLTSLGRSGSTWLMRMLAEHPNILVHDRHPYEARVCSYWMHFVKVLGEPAGLPAPVDFYEDASRLSQFPFSWTPARRVHPPEQAAVDRWYAGSHVEELASMAQNATESFYREYALAGERRAVAYFAEKSAPAGHCAWTIWQLYPRAKEIFLFRDRATSWLPRWPSTPSAAIPHSGGSASAQMKSSPRSYARTCCRCCHGGNAGHRAAHSYGMKTSCAHRRRHCVRCWTPSRSIPLTKSSIRWCGQGMP